MALQYNTLYKHRRVTTLLLHCNNTYNHYNKQYLSTVTHPFKDTGRALPLKYRKSNNYNELYNNFEWNIPKYYNIGWDISDKHVEQGDGNKPAIIQVRSIDDNTPQICTFNQLKQSSNKLANILQHKFSIQQSECVGILSSQCIDTVICHTSIYKLNSIAVPLFVLFGQQAIAYRLNDSKIKLLFVEQNKFDEVVSMKQSGLLPLLQDIIVVDHDSNTTKTRHTNIQDCNIYYLQDLLQQSSNQYDCVHSLADDPAVIIYTSGTTGSM